MAHQWELVLHTPQSSDPQIVPFDAISDKGNCVIELRGDSEKKDWALSYGRGKNRGKVACFEIIGNGLVRFTTSVDRTRIAWKPDGLDLADFELEQHSGMLVRFKDLITFEDQGLSAEIRLPPVEVKSSAVVPMEGFAARLGLDEQETEEEDNDLSIPHPRVMDRTDTQGSLAPFSTALSNMPVMETPTKMRMATVDEVDTPEIDETIMPSDVATNLQETQAGLAEDNKSLDVEEPEVSQVIPKAKIAGRNYGGGRNRRCAPSVNETEQGDEKHQEEEVKEAEEHEVPAKSTPTPAPRAVRRAKASVVDDEAKPASKGRGSKRSFGAAEDKAEEAEVDEDAESIAVVSRPKKKAKTGAKPSPAASPVTSQSTKKKQLDSPQVNGSQTSAAALRIIFSGSEPEKALQDFLVKQGAVIPKNVTNSTFKGGHSTYCCVGNVKTTQKILLSLVHGGEVITDLWAFESQKGGSFLPAEGYRVETMVSGVDRHELFAGKTVMFTKAAKKSYDQGFTAICDILDAAGVTAIETDPKRLAKVTTENSADTIVIGLESGDSEALLMVGNGIKCYKKDILSQSIIQAELLTEDTSLMITAGGGKKRGKKG